MLKGFIGAVLGVLVAIPIVYFAFRFGDQNFRDGAVGNWFGTIVGVIVGVPVALWLTRKEQESQSQLELRQRTSL